MNPDNWNESRILVYGPGADGTSSVQDAAVRWRAIDDRYEALTVAPPLPAASGEGSSLFSALFGLRGQLEQLDATWVLLIAAARRDALWPGSECAPTHVWLYPGCDQVPAVQVHALTPEDDASGLATIQTQVRYHQERLATAAN